VAVWRQLYHQALERRELYVGYGLAVELAEMFCGDGGIRRSTCCSSTPSRRRPLAGLYQVFLEGGPYRVSPGRPNSNTERRPIATLAVSGSLISGRHEAAPPPRPNVESAAR